MNNAIIVANGSFPRRDEALQAMLSTPLLVCCDGAYNKLVDSQLFSRAAQLPKVCVVGDGDSLSCIQPPFPTTFVKDYVDQDTNDLTKAVRYTLTQGVEKIIILGATGLREDHTLGNISLLATYCRWQTLSGKPLGVRMYTDYGYFTPITGTTTLASFAGQQVSLFSMGESLTVSVEGLKYPISRRNLRYWWEATLNEALAENFTVALEGDGEVVVYQTHEAKE